MHHTQGQPGGIGAAAPALVGLLGLLVAVTVAGRLARPARVRVEGASMTPTLEPGDRLLMRRARHLRTGDIVSVPDPREPSRTVVKRVFTIDASGVDVRGDNAGASTDSRTFGPVPRAAVTGIAVYRYHPPTRAGRLRRTRLPGQPGQSHAGSARP